MINKKWGGINMLKTQVGSSVLANAKEAGRQAASEASQGLDKPQIAFVYTNANYDQKAVIDGVKESLPGAKIIGNTSFSGIVTPKGFVSGDSFVGVMAFSDDAMRVGVAGSGKKECAFKTGIEVAKAAMSSAGQDKAPNYFYMAASPGEEEYYLKGITQVIGRVPFFGGSAADNTISGDWKLFTQDVVTGDGVVVAFFYTESAFASVYTGAYAETCKSGIITKLSGDRTLVEIDGIPAVEKYSQWSGKPVDALKGGNLLVETIPNPLGVKDRMGDLVAIRHPMFGNDDGSMNVGNNLAVNTAVIYMDGSADTLVASASGTLTELKDKLQKPAAGYLLVHCGGRRVGIGDRMDEAAAAIQKAAGDVPFIVQFTFGEYGYETDGNNTCGGLMLSYTAFAK